MSCDHEDSGVLCDDRILARLAFDRREAGWSLTVEHIRVAGLLRTANQQSRCCELGADRGIQ